MNTVNIQLLRLFASAIAASVPVRQWIDTNLSSAHKLMVQIGYDTANPPEIKDGEVTAVLTPGDSSNYSTSGNLSDTSISAKIMCAFTCETLTPVTVGLVTQTEYAGLSMSEKLLSLLISECQKASDAVSIQAAQITLDDAGRFPAFQSDAALTIQPLRDDFTGEVQL